jgi:carboxyl-terminal processing protease
MQQDDYEYTLNYDVYLNEREENLKVTDRFKTLNDFDSDLSFEWLPEAGVELNNEIKERRDRWVENLKKDFYINEAVNVLGDLNLSLEASKKLAQNKK